MKILVGLLISLFLVGTSLAEVGWYIPKPNIHVGDKIVYRPDTDNVNYVEKWGYLTEQLEGGKTIDLAGIKVNHLKGNFEPEPFECKSYDNLPKGEQPVEVYVYCRNGKYYALLFEDGILKYWSIH